MKHPVCPKCKSEKVAKFVYGYVVNLDDSQEEIEDDTIILAGCCSNDDSPKWRCNSCHNEFGKRFHTLKELNEK